MNSCDANSAFGCVVDYLPWIIAAMVLFVIVLAGWWFALHVIERRRSATSTKTEPSAPKSSAPPTKPGTPVQPTPAKPMPAKKPAPAQPPPPPAKPTPLAFKFTDKPDLNLNHFRGDQDIQEGFGEVLSAVVLASQGWKQLPSKLHGAKGIDGLFVREVRGGGGFECLAIECKTNTGAYDPATMSDERLAHVLNTLYELGAFSKHTADELTRGLLQGASFFRKELWRHDLSNGLTTISELGRKGEKGKSVTRSNARVVAALFASLEHFDSNAIYLGQQPLDPTS